MPPKKGAKKAVPKIDTEAAAVDEQLLKIDIWVDHVRKELESTMEPAITEMRREIQSMLNRLGSKVKNMKMADFLRECGGDVQGFIEKDKRQAKMARTVARGTAGGASSRAGATVAKVMSKVSRLPLPGLSSAASAASSSSMVVAEVGAGAGAASSSSALVNGAGSSSALPMQTPGHAAPRSRIGDLPPAKTPAMALMKSSAMLPGALGARTPAVSSFLPKTPGPAGGAGVAAAKPARARRRNEMVYHVAVSETGSPIAEETQLGAAATVALVAPAASGAGAEGSGAGAGAAAIFSGAIKVDLGSGQGGAVTIDDEAAVEEIAEDSEKAALMLGALEALQARIEQMKGKIAEKAAAAAAAAK